MFPTIELFGREIGYYPLMVLCGVFAIGIYVSVTSEKRKYDYTDAIIFLLIIVIGLMVGGHLLYALVNYKSFSVFGDIENINTPAKFFNALSLVLGGNVFYGGLIGSIIAGYILVRKNNEYKKYVDIIVVGVPLFHFFGRIGCFLGGCCFGIESKIGFIYKYNPIEIANGVRRFPVQLLEASFNLFLFFLLHYLLCKRKFENKLIYVYLTIYATGRFFLEFLRGDAYRGIWFSLSTSQIISILIILAIIVIHIRKAIFLRSSR